MFRSKVKYTSELKKIRLNGINKELEKNQKLLDELKKDYKCDFISEEDYDNFKENIYVNDDKSVEILFRYKEQYKFALEYLKSQNNML